MVFNIFILGNSMNMKEIPNETIDFIFSSPPYNKNTDYSDDKKNLNQIGNYEGLEMVKLLSSVFKECFRVMKDKRFIAINTSDYNLTTQHYKFPLHAHITIEMLKIGFHYINEYQYHKTFACAKSFVSNIEREPMQVDDIAQITLFIKDKMNKRKFLQEKQVERLKDFKVTDFSTLLKATSQKKNDISHPHKFNLELPKHFIKLYTKPNDLILDMFTGSGSTAIASFQLKRNSINYEISPKYFELQKQRAKNELSQTEIFEENKNKVVFHNSFNPSNETTKIIKELIEKNSSIQ